MEKQTVRDALGFIEEHLGEPRLLGQTAERAHFSSFHFRRAFGLLCDIPLGEYIRRRRLSRAALDLYRGDKVLDVALKYGYGSSESFSRAFRKFHGVNPAQAKRGAPVKNFAPIDFTTECETKMICEIGELPSKTLVGYKAHFHGAPFGEERLKQEHAFYESTRGKQWLLFGAGGGRAEEYAVLCNITEEGYDYYIAYELDEWSCRAIFDPEITGMDTRGCNFEVLRLERCRAAIFSTAKSVHPVADYSDLRAALMKFLHDYDFEFADLPERVVYHWHLPQKEERYIEICLPIL